MPTPIGPTAVSAPRPLDGDAEAPDLRDRFEALVLAWKADSRGMSTMRAMAQHPAYRAIIAMGRPAIPLILREPDREPDHWFTALRAIAGLNPVPAESAGDLRKMAECWTAWGREGRPVAAPVSP